MIERAGKERLAPMLMTALTAGIALVPLALSAGQPGKEILYPVATVILGGLVSSTLLDFFVRPALFWTFGRRAARRAMKHHLHEPDLHLLSPQPSQPHYARPELGPARQSPHIGADHAEGDGNLIEQGTARQWRVDGGGLIESRPTARTFHRKEREYHRHGRRH